MIIQTDKLKDEIKKQVELADKSIIVISAFCKLEALKFINDKLDDSVIEKKILIRWRLGDLICGVTDIEIFNYCISNGWKIYINLDLHAKVYIFNRIKCIIGSSNLTNAGLNLTCKGNIEINTLTDIADPELGNLLTLFENSYELNNDVFELMNDQYELNRDTKLNNLEWNIQTLNLIEINEYKFWSYELLQSSNPYELCDHDRKILGITGSVNEKELKHLFEENKIYKWITKNLGEEEYFGSLTKKLHSDILDDPSVYRMDVKKYLSNIFSWIDILEKDKFIVERPRYSQRVRRINNGSKD